MTELNNQPIYVLLVGLVLSLILGKIIIPMLRSLHAGQSIREDGPQTHLVKAGTPTIGGLIFLGSLILGTLITQNFDYRVFILFVGTFGFAAVGFFDDYLKVINKRNLGFTAKQKIVVQILIAIVLYALMAFSNTITPELIIPGTGRVVNIGLWYSPFIIFVVVGVVNSVNLTDGLDGLSTSVTIVVLLFFAVVSMARSETAIAKFSILLVGGLLGFLVYNKYPAKVFMGDTGSLALGGAVVTIAMLLNLPLLLPLCCGIYFMEALSVIIQVAVFKRTGKRVFLMSPLHHHFEQKGMREVQVVLLFVAVEILLVLISAWLIF
ncbi:MAG: phospho-N-acetylmuramoyl-pentapeptide-transferase [Tissierellia bacterium]|nr:phospho-N-acetylmuramoyl-pentapeptide-transferase [Tissierellia bacterium]